MTTWGTLDTATQRIIDDRNQNVWSQSTVRWLLEHAELLISLYRGLAEVTKDLNLTSGVPLYDIHTVQGGAFSDFIVPLRIRIAHAPLRNTDLSILARVNKRWHLTTGTPDRYFMLGANQLGFYKVPDSALIASITYLRVPPTGAADSDSPVIDSDWHDLFPIYAASVLNAVEGKPDDAQKQIEDFAKLMGIAKDPRFFPQEKEKGETGATDSVFKFAQQ